ITLPQGVKVKIKGNVNAIQRPKGKLDTRAPEGVRFTKQNEHLVAQRSDDSHSAVHGLARVLASNAGASVTKCTTRQQVIPGVGCREEMKGKNTVVFTVGFSHPIEVPLPSGVDCAVDAKQTRLTLTGVDRQKVGQVAADMRALRPPDPYKNKGVRYLGERL